MMKRLLAVCCTLALAGSVACGEVDDDQPADQSGLQLASSVDKKADVKYMEYNVYKVDLDEIDGVDKCKNVDPNDVISQTPPDITEKVKKKKGMTMPGSWDRFHKKPLDPESQHKFFDLFVHVKSGCYVAHVIPLNEDQDPSAKCLPTHGVFDVKPKKMTEDIMISQCLIKPKKGTLDMIVAINKPPKIKDITLDPQKFLECPLDEDKKPSVTSCVKVVEPDKDPVKLEWALKERDEDGKLIKDEDGKPVLKDPFFQIGPDGDYVDYTDLENNSEDPNHSPVQAVNYYPDDTDFVPGFKEIVKNGKVKTVRVVEACIEIKFERSHEHTSADIAVTAFDMLWDFDKVAKTKELIKFEDWFYDRGITDQRDVEHGEEGERIKSRDTRQFAAYIDDCDVIDGKLACNRTPGYWSQERHWFLTDYAPLDEQILCEGEENEADWVEILPPGLRNQFYSLARQYIAATINFDAVTWADVVDVNETAEFFALVVSLAEDLLHMKCDVDFTGVNQAVLLTENLEDLWDEVYKDETTYGEAFEEFAEFIPGFDFEDPLDFDELKLLLEHFNDEKVGEDYCLVEEENND